MAEVAAVDRAELIALYLTMFGKAPTIAKLDFMLLARSLDLSTAEIASKLSADAEFAPIASMSAAVFAEYLTNSLLASDTPAAARAWAIDWVTMQAQGSNARAQIIAEAVHAVLTSTDPDYSSSRNELGIEVAAADHDELIALHLTMFGETPTIARLETMLPVGGFNSSLEEIAGGLAAEAEFAQLAGMNADAFAQYLTDTLLASDIPAATHAWAIDWVTSQVQRGNTKTQIIAEAVHAVLNTTDPDFASSRDALKIEVAYGIIGLEAEAAARVVAAEAAAEAAIAAAAAAVPREFTLTAGIDAFTGGTGGDTVTGLLSDLDVGDVLTMGAGNDFIELMGDGGAGAAQVSSANFDLILTAASTMDAASFTDVGAIRVVLASTTGTSLLVNNGSYATTYGIDATGKTIGLTVDFANSAGSSDTAKLNLTGVGSGAVDISSGNATEAVTMATSGTNSVSLTGGTALSSITITGSGTNTLNVLSSAAGVTVNASAATGPLRLTMALSSDDVLRAGSATTDRLVLGGAVDFSGTTLTGFELLDFAGGNHQITMTLAQHNNFTGAVGIGAASIHKIILTTPGAFTGLTEDVADDMTYVLANGAGNVFTAGTKATDYNLSGGDSATTYIFGTTLTAADVITGTAGIDTLKLAGAGTGSANISAVEIVELNFASAATFTTGSMAGSGAATITAAGSTGNVTLNATSFNAAGATSLTIIDGAGDDMISVPATDSGRGKTAVTLATGGADTITIANNAFNGTTTNFLTINNFSQAAGANQDKIAGLGITTFTTVTAIGTAVAGSSGVLELEAAAGTLASFDAGDAGLVETLLDSVLTTYGDADGTSFYSLVYGSGASAGKSALYQVNVTTAATGITSANIAVELVGVFNGITTDAFESASFV